MNLIMLERVVALLAVLGGQWQLSTVFGSSKWDRHNPNSRLACYRRQIDDRNDMFVAHNTLPCRKQVLLLNPRTQKMALARVGDRGPRHADIDLSRRVAQQLGHNGKEYILVVPLDSGADVSLPVNGVSTQDTKTRIVAADPVVAGGIEAERAQSTLAERARTPAGLHASGRRDSSLSTRVLRQQLQAAAEALRVPPELQASRPVEVGQYPAKEAMMADRND